VIRCLQGESRAYPTHPIEGDLFHLRRSRDCWEPKKTLGRFKDQSQVTQSVFDRRSGFLFNQRVLHTNHMGVSDSTVSNRMPWCCFLKKEFRRSDCAKVRAADETRPDRFWRRDWRTWPELRRHATKIIPESGRDERGGRVHHSGRENFEARHNTEVKCSRRRCRPNIESESVAVKTTKATVGFARRNETISQWTFARQLSTWLQTGNPKSGAARMGSDARTMASGGGC